MHFCLSEILDCIIFVITIPLPTASIIYRFIYYLEFSVPRIWFCVLKNKFTYLLYILYYIKITQLIRR